MTLADVVLDRPSQGATGVCPPVWADTAPFGINNRGQIVGQYTDAVGLHAYLLDDGVYRTIDPPAGPRTTAMDINDLGQIVIPGPMGLFVQF